ncbi:MAG: hypothetical protein JJ909_08045 [Roseivirga sp.]|jgi:hypothetical protein|uniref:hypothetical protein n=1 Tax=Roseivirga sp. TaxID=1964215 RepID=UPI001B20D85E|nr:hypothetical protein [Roseivirga sp.]MBO6495663.1 hypothetical protein [Roseivirga sp.]MBO6659814.1 hypothetical protein [Roseivirga sp.]MBO6760906.1 hypothetical protein [Roseivirga sp.]MBO6907449.1 hypothetical protein [Roseivirga sp.]
MNSQIAFMPKWAVGTLLSFALLLFIFGISQSLTFDNAPAVFILAFACFLPCYIALFMDIAKRRLPYHWGMLMLFLPFLGPYIYFLSQSHLNK